MVVTSEDDVYKYVVGTRTTRLTVIAQIPRRSASNVNRQDIVPVRPGFWLSCIRMGWVSYVHMLYVAGRTLTCNSLSCMLCTLIHDGEGKMCVRAKPEPD